MTAGNPEGREGAMSGRKRTALTAILLAFTPSSPAKGR